MGLTNNLGKLSNMITSTGSAVGIGQPSPSYTLDVSGTGRFTGVLTSAGLTTTGAISLTPSTFSVGSASAADGNSLTLQAANSNYLLRFKNAAGTSIGGFYYDGTNLIADSPSWKFVNNVAIGSLQSGAQGSINGASGTINRAIVNCPYPGASALTLGYYSAGYGLDIWVNGDGTGLAPVYIDQRQNEAIIFRRSTQGTAVESMRIQSGGNVLVGTTTDNGGRICATGANSTSANDSIYLENAALTVCFRVRNDGVIFTGTAARSPVNDLSGAAANLIVAAGGNLQKSTASSIRFKENVNDWIGDGLNTILALKPKTFTYKEDYYSNPQRQFLGLIAEDVAEVSSYLADFENEDGTGQVENVRYANIVVPLIKAVQELNEKLTRNNIN